MVIAQHGVIQDSDVLIPTDDTKTFNILETFGTAGRYYLSSLLHQNPTNKSVVIHTYTDGDYHTDDPAKKIVYRKSTDRGETFGSQANIYDPTDSTMFVQDPGIGYDRRGRLHVLADCHESFSPGDAHALRYLYSDDDAATWSSPVNITLPSNGQAGFRPYGRIIDVGGVLMAPVYFFTDEGDFTTSSRYVLRSTDRGANWTWIEVETTVSEYINESELLDVTNDIIFMVSRQEPTPHQFIMYKSLDAGLTWSRIGQFGTSVTMTISAPCRLHKFRWDDGTWMCVMYFTNKSTATVYAIYGKLSNGIEGGLGLFNVNSLIQLRDDTVILHYGDNLHYNNNLNSRGVWTREINNPNDNVLQYAEYPATQYDTIDPIIYPDTIYSRMASIQVAFAPRGLVSNTDNDYGTVNGSNQITAIKSLRPGPINQNFTATAGGIILSGGRMVFDGTKRLAHGTASFFNFLHTSSAGYTDVNHTVYFVVKPGTGSNPDAAYGIFGNNGASAGGIGWCLFFDDRVSQSRNNAARLLISKGTAGFIIEFANDNVITPNVLQLICIEVDLAQAVQNDKVKIWVNNVLQSTTVTTFSTAISGSSATYVAQIGSGGNNVLPFIGEFSDIIIQNAIDLPSVRNNMNQALLLLNSIP